MILKDIYCLECGYEKEVCLDACDSTPDRQSCLRCGALRDWGVSCNGGTGSRYRYMDWTRDSIRGYVQYSCAEATSATDEDGIGPQRPVMDLKKNDAIHDRARFRADAIDEKRKRLRHRDDSRLGLGKIFFGAGGSN